MKSSASRSRRLPPAFRSLSPALVEKLSKALALKDLRFVALMKGEGDGNGGKKKGGAGGNQGFAKLDKLLDFIINLLDSTIARKLGGLSDAEAEELKKFVERLIAMKHAVESINSGVGDIIAGEDFLGRLNRILQEILNIIDDLEDSGFLSKKDATKWRKVFRFLKKAKEAVEELAK